MVYKKNDNQILFNDMYEKLKYRDIKAITKMYDRLNETMLLAFKISKNYYFAFLFLAASIYLVASSVPLNSP